MSILATQRLTNQETINLSYLDARVTGLELVLYRNPEYLDEYVRAVVDLTQKKSEIIDSYDLQEEINNHVYFDVACGMIIVED